MPKHTQSTLEIHNPAMETAPIYTRLTELLRNVFDDDGLTARPDMTAADVEGWDSLSNLRLIMAVERAFSIKLTASEVGGLESIGHLVEVVARKVSE